MFLYSLNFQVRAEVEDLKKQMTNLAINFNKNISDDKTVSFALF